MDPYTPVYALYVIMGILVMCIVPVTVILFLVRIFGKSTKKTVNSFRQ